jgi:hypothetical protein
MERNLKNPPVTIESQIEYLESLTPDERREYVIKTRDEYLKSRKQKKIGFTLIACLCLAGTLYIWLNTYGISLISSLGILTGIALGIIGSRYLGKIYFLPDESFSADNFTDASLHSYLEDLKKSVKKDYAWWKSTGSNIVITVSAALIILVYIPQTNIFALMMICGGLSAFLIGFAYLSITKTEEIKGE